MIFEEYTMAKCANYYKGVDRVHGLTAARFSNTTVPQLYKILSSNFTRAELSSK